MGSGVVLEEKWPVLGRHDRAAEWLRIWTDLGRAPRTIDAYAQGLAEYLLICERDGIDPVAAATGEPWQYYDLGHGWCTCTFFEQCQHRLACARCDFHTPEDSSKGQLLEAKENLQKMPANIPLTYDERTAVDDGQDVLDHLLERLTDVPTPAGPTPRQLGAPATATLLPIVQVRNGPTP